MGRLLAKCAKYDKIVFLGDAMHLIGKVAASTIDYHPKADAVARLGVEYFKKKKFTAAKDLEPMYLYSRECDIIGR